MPATRIVINIPETNNFDWNTAFALWKENFPTSSKGINHVPLYAWTKINPDTGLPYPHHNAGNEILAKMPPELMAFASPTVETQSDLKQEIDALASAVYKMKREMQKGQKPLLQPQRINAMETVLRTLYSRWSQLDAESSAEIEITESAKPKKRAKASRSPSGAIRYYLENGSTLV